MNDTFHLEDIPRIKNINKADFIEQYLKPQKPVVIEHFIEDWPAYKKWNFDYINDVDVFCFYDEVQYTKNDWRNRNRLLNNNGFNKEDWGRTRGSKYYTVL